MVISDWLLVISDFIWHLNLANRHPAYSPVITGNVETLLLRVSHEGSREA